jgi:hypothetical protein
VDLDARSAAIQAPSPAPGASTNVTGAGTITVSGSYTKVTGSALTTTVGSKFLVYITKINGSYVANIVALQ